MVLGISGIFCYNVVERQVDHMSFFAFEKSIPVEDLGPGLSRQILGHQSDLMLVKVFFEKGVSTPSHDHPHQQICTVLSGEFEVVVDGDSRKLAQGDVFVVPGGVPHQASCLEAGVLLDAFSPRRDDFLQ